MKNIPLILVVLLCFVACNNGEKTVKKSKEKERVIAEVIPEAEPMFVYGMPADSFVVVQDKIGKNDFLSHILGRYKVDPQLIHDISTKSVDVFDVRKFRAGNPYCVLLDADSVAQCFIYEPNQIDYVVFDFRDKDSLKIYRSEKEIEIREREVAGVINNSLYVSMQESDAEPALAIKMSDVFAWTIDFYRIQKGDRYKVIYDEIYVEGEPVGTGEIKAVYFRHKDEDFYAFRFEQDGKAYYFDEKGNSQRKAFLKAPVKFSRISSRYTLKRFHPVLKRNKPHLGTDYAAPHGTPIVATSDGTVIAASYTRGNGNYVKIKHNSTYTTQYLHMSKFAKGIRKGKFVKQGDVIGYVGSTGLATGPHVCYRFWKNGKQVDPYKEKAVPAEPVKEESRDAFNALKDKLIEQLEQMNYNQPSESLISERL